MLRSSFSMSKPSSSASNIPSQIHDSSELSNPTSSRSSISNSFSMSKSHSPVFRLSRRFNSFSWPMSGILRYTTGTSRRPSFFAASRRKCPPMTTFFRFSAPFAMMGSTNQYLERLSMRSRNCLSVCLRGLYSAGLSRSGRTMTTLMSPASVCFVIGKRKK